MAVFMLDVMRVNAAFQSELSNEIVAERPELWSGKQFRIIVDPVCFEWRGISIATDSPGSATA